MAGGAYVMNLGVGSINQLHCRVRMTCRTGGSQFDRAGSYMLLGRVDMAVEIIRTMTGCTGVGVGYGIKTRLVAVVTVSGRASLQGVDSGIRIAMTVSAGSLMGIDYYITVMAAGCYTGAKGCNKS